MRSIAFILGLVLMELVGCAPSQTHRAWSSADSWYQPPTEWTRFEETQPLLDDDIIEVSPDHMTAAEEELRDVACVEISPGRASELTGHSTPPRAGRSLFVVRAVYLNRGTGKFIVTPLGTELLVEHGSLGRSAVPMKRQSLVVRLSQRPETVFVSCSMDE